MAIGPIDGGSLPLVAPRGLQEADTVVPLPPGLDGADGVPPVSFTEMFGELVASANRQGHLAGKAALDLAEGRSDDIHGTMIEIQKAGIEVKLVGNIKNKVVDAFYEIWRMNI